jgi:hypothetical protein
LRLAAERRDGAPVPSPAPEREPVPA